MKRIMGKILFVIIFSMIFSDAYSDSKKDQLNNTVIASIGKLNVTYGELDRAFQKNMNRKDASLASVSKDSVNDFLDLYVKYKLKVLDALDRGFDKDSIVVNDIEQNRKILAETFYYDKMLVEPEVDRLLAMRQYELKFAYIYFKFEDKTNDTSDAYNRGLKVLKQLKSGADFAEMAKQFSDDKQSAVQGGVAPQYVTAGRTQRPIELALYSLKVGDISPELVKTKYGYVILKLLDKQPRKKVRVSHILLNEGIKNETPEDSAKLIEKANKILEKIKNGENFNELAEIYSDDTPTGMNGGDLGSWYSRSSGIEGSGNPLVPPFENAIFALKDGEVSGIVPTEYGYHIIRRDSTLEFDQDEESKLLKKMYKRIYFPEDKKQHLLELRDKFGFKLNRANFNLFLNNIDTTKNNIAANWDSLLTDNIRKKELYKFNKETTTIGDFVDILKKDVKLRGLILNTKGLMDGMDRILDPLAFQIASDGLEDKYPEFKRLMNEFRDGILLFRVEALEVWDKLKFDSVKAKAYFDKLDTTFYTEPSWDISEIYVLNDSLAQDLYKTAKSGVDFNELAAEKTQRSRFREKRGHWGIANAKDNKLAAIVAEKGIKEEALLEPVKYEGGWSIIKVHSYEPVREKTFEEAISDFAPAFQDLMQKNLTDAWLDKVRKKFPVKVEKKKLDNVIKKMKSLN